MAHLTFYRKYRSQTFKEMVGQEHVIQTVINAIENDRLSHAYIFSGPRGTGKTSTARIFAKSVTTYALEKQLDNLDNPICQRITQGTCADVVEIDAASNTGVDNIRDLNDRVNFTPIECQTKFYIIDEAHMLSTGAFNALLKTLEEPPAHTIFILATTEPHRIPITIHSRCQHLRFRNLSDEELISQLRFVSEKESIEISDNALAILARNSSGCMRDALSLLDQMFSFKGKVVTDDDVLSILGTCDVKSLYALVSAVNDSQTDKLLNVLQEILVSGVNPLQLIQDLIFVAQQILALQSGTPEFVKADKEELQRLSEGSSLAKTVALLDTLAKTESETRWFSNPGLLLKIRLMQLLEGTQQASIPVSQVVATAAPSPAPAQKQAPVPSSPPSVPPSYPSQQAAAPKPAVQSNPSFSMPSAPVPQVQTQRVAPVQSVPEPVAEPASPPVPEEPISNELSSIQSRWPAFLENLKVTKPGLYTILRESKVPKFEGTEISIQLYKPMDFFVEKLGEDAYVKQLNQLLEGFFKQSLTFSLYLPQKESAVNDGNGEGSDDIVVVTQMPATEMVEDLSLNEVVELFEGKLV